MTTLDSKRKSGILLHISSLPGKYGIGDLGASAYHFVDWLNVAGQSLWQVLPINPIGFGNSPYMALSAFAGNPLFIDLDDLVSNGWIEEGDLVCVEKFQEYRVDYQKVNSFKFDKLIKASQKFFKEGNEEQKRDYKEFCQSAKAWLDDYALFQSLNVKYDGVEWTKWEKDLVHRDKKSLSKAIVELEENVNFQKFVQWRFDRQWKGLKKYANEKGVKLIGDIPIFVAHHSADVWINPDLFYLDSEGNPTVVAGVPPDYFSDKGQRWGNPLYRWDIMKEQKYKWWADRLKRLFELFDIIRIDHFRGFESYWEIPASEENAINGKWKKGPGEDFFKKLKNVINRENIIAEDLGIITPDVIALREKFGFPGMKVLQFAFLGGVDNAYLPHNYNHNCVVYTGTHDNDTTIGWYEKASEHEKDFVRRYCKVDGHEINWDLIKLALNSIANVVIIPFQDVLSLGSEARMNLPSTVEGNWEWRFNWNQVGPFPADRLYELTALYGRCNPDRLNLI